MKPKLLRITTVPISLHKLLQGQVNYMQKQGFKLVLASAAGKEVKAIEKETGLQVYILPLTRKISPLQDLKALWHTYKLIKKEQPDIVHTHTPKAGIVGMLAAKLAGVNLRIHTVAGLPLLEATGTKRKLLNLVEKVTYAVATKVYPNSYGLQQIILENQFTKAKKLKVLANGSSNGIDTSYFSPQQITTASKQELRKSLGINENDFVFSFAGRLVGDKGINELVTAFEKLLTEKKASLDTVTEQNRNLKVTERRQGAHTIKLLLIGDEERKLDPLQSETVQHITTNPNIITTDWVEDVRPYLAISDVFVFPSFREGMPNVVLQAGAMGLPSIVTNINGSNEIIIHNENGFIIPVKDTEALYNAMQKLYTNTAVRNELANNAREMIVNRFEQQVVWDALLEEYQSLL